MSSQLATVVTTVGECLRCEAVCPGMKVCQTNQATYMCSPQSHWHGPHIVKRDLRAAGSVPIKLDGDVGVHGCSTALLTRWLWSLVLYLLPTTLGESALALLGDAV